MLIVGIIGSILGLAFFVAALVKSNQANRILRKNNVTLTSYTVEKKK